MLAMWRLLFWMVFSRCQADWAETINLAGMQRTLSQMMTKEFLLISRGTNVADNKRKLSISMSSFNSTLHALMVGDSARGILAAPNHQVVTALEKVNAVWITMEELLRLNVDTVRRSDGSLDMVVLEALSVQNVPLLDTSNEVVQSIVDAAQVSGATTNGLVQDIAGRQRTLIQRLAKGILFLAQGVAMTFNMAAYRNTKSLFETSHDGIIQGVPFAGLPVLNKLCTLHQMREVSFYYAQLRPLLTGITNADTPSASQTAADEVAEEACELVEPLFDSMVEAVKLFGDDGSCNPIETMTITDWLAFFSTLTRQQLLTQQSTQYFMQIALRIDVKTSQVESTVLVSGASMNLRHLIEGDKILGIPAPPSQGVVDILLKARETWDTLASEMTESVHLESISSVTVARVEQLSHYILHDLEEVMQQSLHMLNSSQAKAMDLASQQARLSSSVAEYSCLISSGHQVAENWEHLNATRASFESNRWMLLEGAPATETSPAVQKVTDVCVVQQLKEANDLFGELELAALAVSNSDLSELSRLVELSPRAVKAFEGVGVALRSNGSCRNDSLSSEEWVQRHREAGQLSSLTQAVATEFVILQQGKRSNRYRLDGLMMDVQSTVRRILFGSFRPPVAVPPSQKEFEHLLEELEPMVKELQHLSTSTRTMDFVDLCTQLLEKGGYEHQEEYLAEALALEPSWPGRRVDVAMRQLAVARQVFKESILYTSDLRSSREILDAAVLRFEEAHMRLKDGGDGLPAIMLPERQDLLTQWEHVDAAWSHFRAYQQGMTVDDISRAEGALDGLVEQLEMLIPLLHVVDVKNAERFPWSLLVYSILGASIACCCCGLICRIICSRRAKAAASRAEQAAMSARQTATAADEV